MEWINKHWKEGRYYDLWSINHLLSGVVLEPILFYFGFNFVESLIIALFLFATWEVAEIILGIKEHLPNMVTDIVLDLTGFLFVAYYYFILNVFFTTKIFIAIILTFFIFNLWGYLNYKKRRKLDN